MAQVSRRTKLVRIFLVLALVASLAIGSYALWNMFFAPPLVMSSPGGLSHETGNDSLTALIISTITSITSVIALLMSKYTEWQRARLEQKKLAIELEHKELELRELRRRLNNA